MGGREGGELVGGAGGVWEGVGRRVRKGEKLVSRHVGERS